MTTVIVYNPQVDSVRARNIHTWANENNLDAVYELHLNAFKQASANGYETFMQVGTGSAFKRDVHQTLAALPWRDRGLKEANARGGIRLQNPRLMNSSRAEYLLLELGFITNASDMKIFDDNISAIEKILVEVAQKHGKKRIGVVYGHGQGDPGAVGNGRREADEVRRISLNNALSPNTSNKSDKGESDMKKAEVEKLIDARVAAIEKEMSERLAPKTPEGKHWVDPDFNELNAFFSSVGVDEIKSKDHNSICSRAIVIRMLNLLRRSIVKYIDKKTR